MTVPNRGKRTAGTTLVHGQEAWQCGIRGFESFKWSAHTQTQTHICMGHFTSNRRG